MVGALAVLLGKSAAAGACTQAPYEDMFVPSGSVPSDGFAAEIGDPSRSLPVLVDDAGLMVGRTLVGPKEAGLEGFHNDGFAALVRWLVGIDHLPERCAAASVAALPLAPAAQRRYRSPDRRS
jgi:hypothetical protein